MKIPATILCIILIVYLFKVDQKKSEGISNSIWLPFTWVLFSTSRPISFWLNYWFHIGSYGGGSVEEGNAIERLFLTVMIMAGILVLKKRKINWQELFTKNVWIWILLIFTAVSISWSDYPFIALKRWFKTIGTVIMALVILTEEKPYEALCFILRRIAYIHLPLSVLFIKYYPGLGRFYHSHGATINAGVSGYKNGLGFLCMISGIYFVWNPLLNRWKEPALRQNLHYSIYLIILPMIAWLLYKANSSTALACLVIAIGLLIVARQVAFARSPGRIMALGAVVIFLYAILEYVLGADINNFVISMLGRRPDLTTRVPMWEELLSMVKNPVVGFGFESFWLGERADIIEQHWGISVQAHNGYLDVYLNLGYIGLIITVAYILAGLKKVYHYLFKDYPNAILRLCLVIVFVLSNWTENSFHLGRYMWLLLLFSIMDKPSTTISTN
ncbi:MAG: O-Antigen ligase [Syntrophus sp. PtaB.Bin138]|nr:MAG: O-Antigen ligase [Syntrophus sp. PtaB.Bin138]